MVTEWLWENHMTFIKQKYLRCNASEAPTILSSSQPKFCTTKTIRNKFKGTKIQVAISLAYKT